MGFDHDELLALRNKHPAWRLLRADSAPLVAGFLQQVFVDQNRRTIGEHEVVEALDDYLFEVQAADPGRHQRAPKAYLTDWAHPDRAWLRKYYPPDSDEAFYDLTPATQKALSWLDSLAERSFVGTESRLLTVIQLLRQISEGGNADPTQRIEALQQRRAAIDEEIARIESGDLHILDDAALRDRFQQVTGTARELLADFREVEENFRRLDRSSREQIAAWDGPRGELLDEVFGEHESIRDSDQGRSFQAFYDLLMSADQQEELQDLLDKVLALPALAADDRSIKYVQHDWLRAGDSVQQTVARLSHQLRRFLDDQAYLDNRRIAELVRQIEGKALRARDDSPTDSCAELVGPGADIHLPMLRRMYEPTRQVALDSASVTRGDDSFAADELFELRAVDSVRLRRNVTLAMQGVDQVALAQVTKAQPIEQGLAEVVSYLQLADEDSNALIDSDREEQLHWTGDDGVVRKARVPLILFTRGFKNGESQPSD